MTGPRVTIRDLRRAAARLEDDARRDTPGEVAKSLELVADWLFHEIAGRRIAAENRAAQKRRRTRDTVGEDV